MNGPRNAMKTPIILLALFFATTVMAQAEDPIVHYMLPSVQQLTGHAPCENRKPYYQVQKKGPHTGDFSGEVFTHEMCVSPSGDHTWYSACADIVWDSTGVILSYTILWRRQDEHPPSGRACFTQSDVS